ncbi:pre-rRNA-processing protein TSR2 homolog [Diprion similis]|uniref:pre-rRNA-processing protein TSR2 homolog n=1 Tax=Diprion similis TaxID=362088 RepID=UPI001EF92ED2|nr:pre-rRNA-processing protein TSR2 homolog [Diprion similis]
MRESRDMASTKDFFLTISERVFSNWTALKLAVDHGMGSKDRAEDFPAYITEVLYMNEGLDTDDLAAEIEEYMDEAFQTELQDDSAADVAKVLLRFHKYCMDGDEATAVTEMAKLPPLQPWIMRRKPAKDTLTQPQPPGEVRDNVKSQEAVEKMDAEEEEDDGWTEVKTRRQK